VSLRAGEDKDWERRREEVEEMEDARAWRGVLKPILHVLIHIKCLVDIWLVWRRLTDPSLAVTNSTLAVSHDRPCNCLFLTLLSGYFHMCVVEPIL